MKGLRIFGEYLAEILLVTLFVALSAASVVFFIPMMVGLNGFFRNNKETRLYKDIFQTMKENVKILIPFTIFELLIIVFPVLNIYYFNTNPDKMNGFLLAISYIALFIGGIYLATAPTIIVNMKVSFPQLIYNGFMLLFGGLLRSILSLLLIAGVLALVLYYPYAVIATFYLLPFLLTRLMLENFYVLKARVLGSNVYQVKKAEQEDDYLSQNGGIALSKQTEEQHEK